MNHVNRFEQITKTATDISNSWTNREVAMFHYFNPNGLLAAKRITDDQISKLVDEGKANSGAIMAYGSLNFFYYDKLSNLIDKKSVRNADLVITLQGLRDNIESATKFINEKI